RQGQALVMTPQLMQAIKLLQLSNLDLAAFVNNEVESNPLLERGEEGDLGLRGAQPEIDPNRRANDRTGGASPDRPGARAAPVNNRIDDEAAVNVDTASSWRNNSGSLAQDWSSAGANPRPDLEYNMEAFVSAEMTLSEHLAAQLAITVADPAQR